MVIGWIDTVIQGMLLGGLYALFAAGLSLIFGVMRLVNLAHGDLIVLAAFVILAAAHALGLGAFAATAIALPVMFAAGYALQFLVLNRTLGTDILPPLLVTFGLSIIVQNSLLEMFSADSQRLSAGAITVVMNVCRFDTSSSGVVVMMPGRRCTSSSICSARRRIATNSSRSSPRAA